LEDEGVLREHMSSSRNDLRAYAGQKLKKPVENSACVCDKNRGGEKEPVSR